MISIRQADSPDYLQSEAVQLAKEEIRTAIDLGNEPNFKGHIWRNPQVKKMLHEMQHGKCCYCERNRDITREIDVDHFRPKGNVRENNDHHGYWWLPYEWTNLLMACKICNEDHKKDHFPLLHNEDTRIYTEERDVDTENKSFINPRFENPLHFIGFRIDEVGGMRFIRAIPKADINSDEQIRARDTIEKIGLNRDTEGHDLVKERGKEFSPEVLKLTYRIKMYEDKIIEDPIHAEDWQNSLDSYRNLLKPYVVSNRTFCGVYRDYLDQHNIDYSDLIELAFTY